ELEHGPALALARPGTPLVLTVLDHADLDELRVGVVVHARADLGDADFVVGGPGLTRGRSAQQEHTQIDEQRSVSSSMSHHTLSSIRWQVTRTVPLNERAPPHRQKKFEQISPGL